MKCNLWYFDSQIHMYTGCMLSSCKLKKNLKKRSNAQKKFQLVRIWSEGHWFFLFHVQKMIPSVTERGSPHVILRGIMQVMHTQAYDKTNHNNMTLCIHFKVKGVQNNHHYRFLFKWIASIRLLQMSVSCWHRCHGRRTEFRYTQESIYPTTKNLPV